MHELQRNYERPASQARNDDDRNGGRNIASVDQLFSMSGGHDNVFAVLVVRNDGHIDIYDKETHPLPTHAGRPGDPINHGGANISRICTVNGSPGCVEINGKIYCD